MLKGHFTGKLFPFGLDTLQAKSLEILPKALQLGLNLIDSSTQFKATESAIGRIINEIISKNTIKRSDICLSTKVGIHFGNEAKHLTKIKQDLSYSIHPEYIESQLTDSLLRLGVETIDMFSLNTPERLLQSPEWSTTRLGEQISMALEHLELEKKRGRIMKVGIASTAKHLQDYMHLDGFDKVQVLQFPLNVFEKEAIEEELISKWTSKGITCLSQRPRTAITKTGVIKLIMADLEKSEPEINQASTNQFDVLSELELDLTVHLGNDSLATRFVISKLVLESLPTLLENRLAAEFFLKKNVMKELDDDLKTLAKYAKQITEDEYLKEFLQKWIEDYRLEVEKLIKAVLEIADYHQNRTLTDLNDILNRYSKWETSLINNTLGFAKYSNNDGVVVAEFTESELDNLKKIINLPPLSPDALEEIICNPDLQ